jgi:YD repeat-containing protein
VGESPFSSQHRNSRPSKLKYPSGREAEYTYDDRQLLKTIKWETAQIEDRSYNDAGMLTGVDRAFVDETRTYNAGSQLTQINNTNVGSQTYTYDLNGNVTSESLSVTGRIVVVFLAEL